MVSGRLWGALDSSYVLVGLTALMEATAGSPEIAVAVIDGPVDRNHAALAEARITLMGQGVHDPPDGAACRHATFIAGLLCGDRNSEVPGICPGCSVLVRPVFAAEANFAAPSAEPDELAAAILEAIDAGARVINLNLAFSIRRLGPCVSPARCATPKYCRELLCQL